MDQQHITGAQYRIFDPGGASLVFAMEAVQGKQAQG